MMKIELGNICCIHETGGRGHQEDSYSPDQTHLSPDSRAFCVCDGMGGHSNGEIASRIISETMVADYPLFMEPEPSESNLLALFRNARYLLEQDEHAHEGKRVMGTTLTFVGFTKKGLYVAHLGDSVIYVLRPGRVTRLLYRSEDHSQTYRMIKNGQITPIQGLFNTQRNIMDKAVMPFTLHDPDIRLLTDLQAGDYIMLCTDGITENLTDEMVRFIFAPYRTTDEIEQLLRAHCQLSTDNYTALIIPVVAVEHEESDMESSIDSQPETKTDLSEQIEQEQDEPVLTGGKETSIITTPQEQDNNEITGHTAARDGQKEVVPAAIITSPMPDETPCSVGETPKVDYSSIDSRDFRSDELLVESMKRWHDGSGQPT